MAPENGNAQIIAVDDQPANLRLLEDLLAQRGHRVRSFPRGRLAVEAATRNPPDLILLDINMPEMSGFQVCELLKADPRLSAIPVIFLSAIDDASAKVQALQCGGVDYVTKPFEINEVQARVETHLKIHQLQKKLRMHADHLEELVAHRTRELAETQARLRVLDRAKSDFLRLIHHELRSPLNGILGVGELILSDLDGSDESAELRQMFRLSRRRMLAILDDALLLTEIEVTAETFRAESSNLEDTLEAAVKATREFSEARGVRVEMKSATATRVRAKGDLLEKALGALIETAVKFSKAGEAIEIECRPAGECVQIKIRGGGRVPESALAGFFQVFSIADAITPGGDLGLGPPVAQKILSLFGGGVSVENLEPSGVELSVSLRAVGPVESSTDESNPVFVIFAAGTSNGAPLRSPLR